jgi:hypothetical protein
MHEIERFGRHAPDASDEGDGASPPPSRVSY